MQENFRKQIASLGRLLTVFGLLLVTVFMGIFYLKNHPDALKSSEVYEVLPAVTPETAPLDAQTIAQSGFINDEGVSGVIQNCTQLQISHTSF